MRFDETLELGGVRQFISIRAAKPNLPLLLYLHGGPGDAALPLMWKYNSGLEESFTVVVWEQRGAGKSYYPFGATEQLCIDRFVQDTHALAELLLKRFHQPTLFLAGHSWGSVLGVLFCKQYPHLVRAYIGCGQVVNMRKSLALAYDYAVQHSTGKTAARLAQIDCAYTSQHWLQDLLFVTKQVVKCKGSLYGATNYNRFVRDFLFSKEYTLKDLLNREKGALQSIRVLWQELMQLSFEDTTAFAMPVIFIEGEYDYHVSSALVKAYYDTITTEKAFYLFDKSCHFPQWSEPERFNVLLSELATRY